MKEFCNITWNSLVADLSLQPLTDIERRVVGYLLEWREMHYGERSGFVDAINRLELLGLARVKVRGVSDDPSIATATPLLEGAWHRRLLQQIGIVL